MLVWILVTVVLVVALSRYYAKTHPLVFNESFWQHAHCIKQAGGSFSIYASDHYGKFPFHTNGYGDALLLLEDAWLPSLTGPGYTVTPLEQARANKTDVPESECGRVYVQGLKESDNPKIAILFDKLPTPGDHRHLIMRIWAPLVREVWTIGDGMRVVRNDAWPTYAKEQIELLVEASIPRKQAEAFYAELPKR
jgi:hypothetical protein